MNDVPIDFARAAAERNATFRHYLRLAALTKLFWMEHLRFAASTVELFTWARCTGSMRLALDPSSVLTHEEMALTLEEARHAPRRRTPEAVEGGRRWDAASCLDTPL
jgi:hypothetical protein